MSKQAANTPQRMWRRHSEHLGLDFHVALTLLFRAWNIVAGAATVLLLPICLSPVEQGYYFTFASVLALQVFFELGLNQVLVQLVGHEIAHLKTSADGQMTGPTVHLERLRALVRLTRAWYGVSALLFMSIGGLAGAWFFWHRGGLPPTHWLGVWIMMVGATAVNLWFSPRLAVLEGCGRVGHVARLRLIQAMAGYAALWLLLFAGAGLWVAVAVPAASALCTGYWLRRYGKTVDWLMRTGSVESSTLRWSNDVFPLQWRIAVSWVSGYFISNLFTPLIFSRYGAAEAGRLGLALTLFTAISTIGMSWVSAKAPVFAMHIARRERADLNHLFKTVAIRSLLFTAVACFAIIALTSLLAWMQVPFMHRIASPGVLIGLALTTVVNCAVFAAAVYMRAHREEPMLPISVTMAFLTAAAVYLGSMQGVLPMIAMYAGVTTVVALPWTATIFLKYYRRAQ